MGSYHSSLWLVGQSGLWVWFWLGLVGSRVPGVRSHFGFDCGMACWHGLGFFGGCFGFDLVGVVRVSVRSVWLRCLVSVLTCEVFCVGSRVGF